MKSAVGQDTFRTIGLLLISGCIAFSFHGCERDAGSGLTKSRGPQSPMSREHVLEGRPETLPIGASPDVLKDSILYLSPMDAARKASRLFAGRHPTSSELDRLANGHPEATQKLKLEWLQSEFFANQVARIFEDRLHVTAAQRITGATVAAELPAQLFPDRLWYNAALPVLDQAHGMSNELCTEHGFIYGLWSRVERLTFEGRDVRELLTDPAIYVNQCAARSLGLENSASWPEVGDSQFFLPINAQAVFLKSQTDERRRVVFSGLLTDFSFLKRYPFTPGNLNRSRANLILREFIGIDLTLFEIPETGDKPFGLNPTLTDARCTNCHTILDPVAHLFRNFSSDYPVWLAGPSLMQLGTPGLLGQDFQEAEAEESDEPIRWLASSMSTHPGFLRQIVRIMWRGLLGYDLPGQWVVELDNGEKRSLIDDLVKRWSSHQKLSFQALAFEISNTRAFSIQDAVGNQASELDANGFRFFVLADPEQLVRRFLHVLELPENLATRLSQDFRELALALGGVDHFQVLEPQRDPTVVWASALQRLSLKWSCVKSNLWLASMSNGPDLQADLPSRLPWNRAAASTGVKPLLMGLLQRALGRDPTAEEIKDVQTTWEELLAVSQQATNSETLSSTCDIDGAAVAQPTGALLKTNAALRATLAYILMSHGIIWR